MTLHRYHTLPDFLSQPRQEPELLLRPWLPSGGITMLYGARGGGKTGVTLAAALAVACGTSLLGEMYAPRPRRVLYVDGEMAPTDVQKRLRKLIAGMPGAWETPNLAVLTHADYEHGIPDLHASGGAGQQLIEWALAMHKADLVILDNISALFRSGEENSNDSWVTAAEWLLKLRRENVATLLIHHAGKRDIEGRLRQRGASKREDLMDAVLQLDETAKPSDGRVPLRLTYEKFRGFTPAELSTDFSLVYDDEAARAWIEDGNWQRRENKPAADAPKWLERARELSGHGLSLREIGKEVGASYVTVSRWLKKDGIEPTLADLCEATAGEP
jgi:putative DNA primase/helicase